MLKILNLLNIPFAEEGYVMWLKPQKYSVSGFFLVYMVL